MLYTRRVCVGLEKKEKILSHINVSAIIMITIVSHDEWLIRIILVPVNDTSNRRKRALIPLCRSYICAVHTNLVLTRQQYFVRNRYCGGSSEREYFRSFWSIQIRLLLLLLLELLRFSVNDIQTCVLNLKFLF